MIRGSNKSNFNCARGYRIKSSSSRQMAPSGKIKCWRRPLGDTFSNTWCNNNTLYSTYTLALILEINNQAGNFESKHKWWSKTTRKNSHKTRTNKYSILSHLLVVSLGVGVEPVVRVWTSLSSSTAQYPESKFQKKKKNCFLSF